MTAQLLSGKLLAQEIEETLRIAIGRHIALGKRAPTLAVILIGQHPASQVYVRRKEAACQKTGIISRRINLPDNISEHTLLDIITALNQDTNIDGILVQLPLPAHIQKEKILAHIDPQKDVDGFHPYNLGRLAQGHPLLRPCTPYGIMRLLTHYGIALTGLHAVVVGASTLVGRPMALELLLAGATVTICHSKTQALEEHVKMADLLISAIGKRDIIQSNWIKPGAVVVDVGIHRQENNALCGDLDFDSAAQKASFITPVPGGVGPMTVAMLMENTAKKIIMVRPKMKKYVCLLCGWIYDEAKGYPEEGIPPGTHWEDVPPNWCCPECGASKFDFEMVEI